MSRRANDRPHRKPIQVKLTEEERATINEAAARNGADTSTWMRAVCLRSARAQATVRK